MKTCTKCLKEKEETEFYDVPNYDNFVCLECWHSPDPRLLLRTDLAGLSTEEKRLHTNKKQKKSRLKIQYNMSLEDYDALFIKQEGKCAICKIPHYELKKELFVDHCHKTGKVRGLLCQKCNHALGLLQDSVENAENLVEYLKNNIE